jgi:hypothetical protein
MLGGHDKRAAHTGRDPRAPARGTFPKEAAAQDNDHTIQYTERVESFSSIVEQGGSQQIRVGLPAGFQMLKHRVGMNLFRGLHPAKKINLETG